MAKMYVHIRKLYLYTFTELTIHELHTYIMVVTMYIERMYELGT
jgi:hypothetical protein